MSEKKLSIIQTPYQFAAQWYDVDGIHRAVTRSKQKQSLGDLPDVPEDVYSRDFAEWLADQYRLAMLKGAELAKQELKTPQLLAACKLLLEQIADWKIQVFESDLEEGEVSALSAIEAAVKAAEGDQP